MNTHPVRRRRVTRVAAASLAGLAGLASLTFSAGPAAAQLAPGTTPTTARTTATTPTTATGTNPSASLRVAKANMVAAPATTDVTIFWTGVVSDDQGNVVNEGKPVEAGAGCTAFTVGSDGYLATAGHCVDPTEGVTAVLLQAIDIEYESGAWTKGEDKVPVTKDELTSYAAKHWSVSPERDVRVHVPQVAGHVTGANDHNYISARVVDFLAPADGDLSLLKIEATDLPVLELADVNQVREGMDVVSIGFASATGDLTDEGTPTYKDGKVSSIRTMEGGKLPVYETSAALNPGMSGGPSVDADGQVIGVNSFHHRDAASFNYIMPSSLLGEMLRKNGVDTKLSSGDEAYRAALDAMNAGDAATADAKFKEVLTAWPTHVQALKLEKDAAAAAAAAPKPVAPIGAAGNIPAASTAGAVDHADTNGQPVALLVGFPLVILAGGAVFIVLATRGKGTSTPVAVGGPVPPAFGGGAYPQPQPQPQPPSSGFGFPPAPAPAPMAAPAPAPAPVFTPPAPAPAPAPAWGRQTVATPSPMAITAEIPAPAAWQHHTTF